jgi:hypothetical protein
MAFHLATAKFFLLLFFESLLISQYRTRKSEIH